MELIRQNIGLDYKLTQLGVKDKTLGTQDFRRCKCGWGFFYNSFDSKPQLECPYCGNLTPIRQY